MKINIRDEQKVVDIWLSKAEQSDPSQSDTLRKICAEYGPRKYTVAVFKSGEDDLLDLTSDLLLCNRRKLAEREMREERCTGPDMTMGI